MSREIDMKVAVVLGAEWQNLTPKGRKKVLVVKGGRPMVTLADNGFCFHGPEDNPYLPRYSTVIADAFKAVDFIADHRFSLSQHRLGRGWECALWSERFQRSASIVEAPTPAMAIALAVLEVAGVQR